jgi:hypothetical protein
MYHINAFGKDNSAGPGEGWNSTTIRNTDTTVNVERVLYGRLLELQPAPSSLTYLAHYAGSGKAVLSHYISTSGASGFDQILAATVTVNGKPFNLRTTWATYITIPGANDNTLERLTLTGKPVTGLAYSYDANFLPITVTVTITVTLEYYIGTSDGFAGFGTMCPFASGPQSPSTCMN